jgi:hypothetical protein
MAYQTPSRSGIVLYLDIDGVLHHEEVLWGAKKGIYMCPRLAPNHSLFEWAHFLIAALAPFPEIQLVLSSSWCRTPGYGKTLKRLPLELRKRFIGGTFHKQIHGADPWLLKQFVELPRGVQVFNDVCRRKPMAWLALDDDDEGWPELVRGNLIKCDGATGLSAQSVRDELHLKLGQCQQTLQKFGGTADRS